MDPTLRVNRNNHQQETTVPDTCQLSLWIYAISEAIEMLFLF